MILSVIIVSYNVKSYLRQCLNSIFASRGVAELEVIVVDNYSFDDSCILVKSEFPQIRLIENQNNVGFSVAVNQGVELAKGCYVCFFKS